MKAEIKNTQADDVKITIVYELLLLLQRVASLIQNSEYLVTSEDEKTNDQVSDVE